MVSGRHKTAMTMRDRSHFFHDVINISITCVFVAVGAWPALATVPTSMMNATSVPGATTTLLNTSGVKKSSSKEPFSTSLGDFSYVREHPRQHAPSNRLKGPSNNKPDAKRMPPPRLTQQMLLETKPKSLFSSNNTPVRDKQDTDTLTDEVNQSSKMDHSRIETRKPNDAKPSNFGHEGKIADAKSILNRKWHAIHTGAKSISSDNGQSWRASDPRQEIQPTISRKESVGNKSNTRTVPSTDSHDAITTHNIPENNDIPTATASLDAIYQRNVIPNVRQSATQDLKPKIEENSFDALGTRTTGDKDDDDENEEEEENFSQIMDPLAKLEEVDEGISFDDEADDDFTAFGDQEMDGLNTDKAGDDLTVFNAQEIINTTAPWPNNGTSAILTIHLENEGHSVLVTWTIHRNVTEVIGFIVSYKMEGREDYDSSHLGKQVRKFTLHSLHEDKEYSICVVALDEDHQHMVEACKGWSQRSSKMVVGIVAGVTLIIPCLLFLALIVYKDKQIKRKLYALAGGSVAVNDSERSLIDVAGEKAEHSDRTGASLGQTSLEQNVFFSGASPQTPDGAAIYSLTGVDVHKHSLNETNFQNGHLTNYNQRTKMGSSSNDQITPTTLSNGKEEKNS